VSLNRDAFSGPGLGEDWRTLGRTGALTVTVQQQIAELTLIRQSLYDLENTHQKVRQE
jgi:hypothetical protein